MGLILKAIGLFVLFMVFWADGHDDTQEPTRNNTVSPTKQVATSPNHWDCNNGICTTPEQNYGATQAVIFNNTVGMLAPNSSCNTQTSPKYWGNAEVNGYNITWVSACSGTGLNFIYPKWDDGQDYVREQFIASNQVTIETGGDAFVFSAMGFTKALKQAY